MLPGHGQHFAALLERKIGGDQRAAALAGLDDDRAQRQARDDAVAAREVDRVGRHARGELRNERRRHRASTIWRARPAFSAGYTWSSPLPRTAMVRPPAWSAAWCADGVDALGQAADDGDPGRGEVTREALGDRVAIAGRAASADQGDRRGIGWRRAGRERTAPAADRRPDAGWPDSRRRAA